MDISAEKEKETNKKRYGSVPIDAVLCVSLASTPSLPPNYTPTPTAEPFKAESNYDLERVIELLDVIFIEGHPLQGVIYITIDGNHNHSTSQRRLGTWICMYACLVFCSGYRSSR